MGSHDSPSVRLSELDAGDLDKCKGQFQAPRSKNDLGINKWTVDIRLDGLGDGTDLVDLIYRLDLGYRRRQLNLTFDRYNESCPVPTCHSRQQISRHGAATADTRPPGSFS